MPIKKILALKLRSMGDTVLLTAPLAELRNHFPRAEIHVAVTTQWASLLEGHPAPNKIWHYERRKEPPARAKAIARLAYRFLKEKYDLAINFHASPSSSLLAFSTGAKTRSIHFHGHKDKNRYSTVEIAGKGKVKPNIERDMDTLRALGLQIQEGILPKIYLSEAEKERGRTRLDELGLQAPFLGLGLGASRPTKIWPMKRFADLAVEWCQKLKGSAFAVVGPGEETLTQDFQKAVDERLNGESSSLRKEIRKKIVPLNNLPLRHLASMIQHASIFAGNDSGPRHLAVSVGIPTVTFIGPEHPYEWHPYPLESHPIFYLEHLSCRKDALPGQPPWCALTECLEQKHRCMQDIQVQEVFNQCMKLAK